MLFRNNHLAFKLRNVAFMIFLTIVFIASNGPVEAQSCADLSKSGPNLDKDHSEPGAYLGLDLIAINEEFVDALGLRVNAGDFIDAVRKGGNGDLSGIRPGDIITAVDDCPVTHNRHVYTIFRTMRPGQIARLKAVRDGHELTISATLQAFDPAKPVPMMVYTGPTDYDDRPVVADMPSAALPASPDLWHSIGAEGLAMTRNFAREMKFEPEDIHGVILSKVNPDSDLAAWGLMRGDIILSANYVPISRPEELQGLINYQKNLHRRFILLRIGRRQQAPVFFVVRLTPGG